MTHGGWFMATFAAALALAGDVKLDWKGHRAALAETPVSNQKPAQVAAGWAAEHGYGATLNDDARVLVIAKTGAAAPLGIAVRTLVFQDDEFDKRAPKTAIAIGQMASEGDFGSLLDDVGKAFPAIASWCASSKGSTGIVISDPPIGAFLEKPKDLKGKEWHAQNELVHRVALLDLQQRYGKLPYWLESGFAWRAEIGVCNSVFCFPGRSGFVAAGEHRGWQAQLAATMKPRGDKPLEIGDVADFARGTYDKELAVRAWGTAEYLTRFHKAELPALFAALAELRDRESKKTHPDGTWEIDASYEIPTAKQLEILQKVVQADFLAELSRFFAQGPSFTPHPAGANR
jgi:hypothetical protein